MATRRIHRSRLLKSHDCDHLQENDSSDLNNYRPITVMNSIYKIFSALILSRNSLILDPHKQNTQFGYRKSKSIADALPCTRRTMEYGEKTDNRVMVILFDWGSAVDKVSRAALRQAVACLSVDIKYRNLIKTNLPEPYL